MKTYGIFAVILAIVLILTPIAAVNNNPAEELTTNAENTKQNNLKENESKASETKSADADTDPETIKVFRSATGKVTSIDKAEYVIGAVAAEMPASYHEEALKAQALASYTYALYMKKRTGEQGNADLSGANLSDNSDTHQGYISKEERKKKWGEKYDAYEKKIEAAVKAVQGKYIAYENEPIIAAFHAISGGKTETAKTVWGNDVVYLKSVESPGDRLSPNFTSTLVLSSKEFADMAKALGLTLSGDASKWFGERKASASGTVTSILIGGKSITGEQMRDAFGLKSNSFLLTYKDSRFTFKVTGYGHFVGMSQYGADYMARQGSKYTEIVKHYYSGIEIKAV